MGNIANQESFLRRASKRRQSDFNKLIRENKGNNNKNNNNNEQ